VSLSGTGMVQGVGWQVAAAV